MSTTATGQQREVFSEFVRPSLWSLVPASLLGLGVGLVSLPILDTSISLALALLTTIATVAAFFGSGYWVKVVATEAGAFLQVGAARVPVSVLSGNRLARGAQMVAERGPNLDSRAFRKFQSGVPAVVIAEVADENDPTPYWIFNVRKAVELVEVLNSESTNLKKL